MQVSKDCIRNSILETAQKLFLQKGYSNVSMREISFKSKVGLSNIYNYFKNKDELFRTLSLPAAEALNKILVQHHGQEGADMADMKSEQFLRKTLQEYLIIVKKYKKEMTLLLFCSRGSSMQNFKEEFICKATSLVRNHLYAQKKIHTEINDNVSDFFINLHSVWMFVLLEELLKNKVKDNELEKILNEYIRFETIGWRELIEL